MFGLGVWEIAVILAVALVVLGPRRLPQVAKQVGRTLREFRRAAADFQVSLEQEADDEEARQRRAQIAAAASVTPETTEPDDEKFECDNDNEDDISDDAKETPGTPSTSDLDTPDSASETK